MSRPQDTSFPRLVSLACHDLRTPLATVHGFARTISRTADLGEPTSRYVEMIEAASAQLAELLDELSLAARIESGRYDPTTMEADSLELAHSTAERLGEERVGVAGTGAKVRVDVPAVDKALSALVRCALRHGGLERVELRVEGPEVTISPITPSAAPVVLGQDLRDLGAAVAVRALGALGGSVELDGETLRVRLPTGGGATAGGP
jgi:signal transduction histidine kinase